MNGDCKEEIERKIAELKKRFPAHSIPPQMWAELEELEEQLNQVEESGCGDIDAGEDSASRL